MRENAAAKGGRYVSEGRLLVDHVVNGEIRARCKGDGAIYRLGYRNGKRWCDCPAPGRCSHLYGLGLVAAPARGKAP
jgi:uncharacterized Zn finger protein